MTADQIGSDYIMSSKPNPSHLANGPLGEDIVRHETERALAACRRNNTSVEFTLKDISSISNRPEIWTVGLRWS